MKKSRTDPEILTNNDKDYIGNYKHAYTQN